MLDFSLDAADDFIDGDKGDVATLRLLFAHSSLNEGYGRFITNWHVVLCAIRHVDNLPMLKCKIGAALIWES